MRPNHDYDSVSLRFSLLSRHDYDDIGSLLWRLLLELERHNLDSDEQYLHGSVQLLPAGVQRAADVRNKPNDV